jgi:hypothetical protein
MRNPMNNWREHPIQQGATTLLGMLGGPLAGMVARLGFGLYNRHQLGQTQNAQMDQLSRANSGFNNAIWGNVPSGTPDLSYTSPFGDTSPLTGFSPQVPGQGLPQASTPWWSTPGVVGGWVAPNGVMDFLGNPDQVVTPDGTGVSLPVQQAPQQQAKPDWRLDTPIGGAPGEMGVMGRGANGEAFIRGVAPFGGNQRYFRNRREMNRG